MKIFRTLDIYIIKKFLGTFFYAITLIISIAVVFDISENLDEFLSKGIPTKDIVFDYYLNFIPYFANLFSSLFTFVAVIYFSSKMAYNTEIIAILSSGMSYMRLMWPYMVSAFIIAVFTFILGNYVIPPANGGMIGFKEKYIAVASFETQRNIHYQIEPGVFIYIQTFSSSNVGYRFTLEKFENRELKEKLTADNIRWDEERKKWVINNYWKRIFHKDREEIVKGYQLDTTLNMSPADFKIEKKAMETLTTPELNREIDKLRLRGVNTVTYVLERHKRISGPFSAFILTMIGATLASRKIKGGLGFHLGLGLLFSFSYILFMQISTVFAVNGNTPPGLAVWIPNLIYSVIAFFTYRWAAK